MRASPDAGSRPRPGSRHLSPLLSQIVGVEERMRADAAQKVGLPRFERDQAAKDMQQVEEIGRAFGQPMVRLDAVERQWGRRSPMIGPVRSRRR